MTSETHPLYTVFNEFLVDEVFSKLCSYLQEKYSIETTPAELYEKGLDRQPPKQASSKQAQMYVNHLAQKAKTAQNTESTSHMCEWTFKRGNNAGSQCQKQVVSPGGEGLEAHYCKSCCAKKSVKSEYAQRYGGAVPESASVKKTPRSTPRASSEKKPQIKGIPKIAQKTPAVGLQPPEGTPKNVKYFRVNDVIFKHVRIQGKVGASKYFVGFGWDEKTCKPIDTKWDSARCGTVRSEHNLIVEDSEQEEEEVKELSDEETQDDEGVKELSDEDTQDDHEESEGSSAHADEE